MKSSRAIELAKRFFKITKQNIQKKQKLNIYRQKTFKEKIIR